MNWTQKHSFILWTILLVMSVLSFIFHLNNAHSKLSTSSGEDIKNEIHKNLSEKAQQLHGVDTAFFLNDSLIRWTNHAYVPDRTITSTSLVKQGHDIYFCSPYKSHITYLTVASYGRLIQALSKSHAVNFNLDLTQTVLPLSDSRFNQKSVLRDITYQNTLPVLLLIGLILTLLLIGTGFLYLKKQTTLLWFLALITLVIRFLINSPWASILFTNLDIFQPDVFASSTTSSIGQLFINALCAVPFCLALSHWLKVSRLSRSVRALLTSCILFFGIDLLLGLMKSLVLDSTINIDLSDGHAVTMPLVLMLLILFITFLILHRFVLLLISFYSEDDKRHFIISFISGFILFYAFQKVDAARSFFGLLPTLLIGISYIIGLLAFKTNWIRKHSFYLISLTTLTISFLYNDNQHELEYLQVYANKLLSNKDLTAENKFIDFENRLAEEFLIPKELKGTSDEQDIFENRLRKLYFSGYLSKYDLEVVSFDSSGNNVNSNPFYKLDDLNEIYNFQSYPTVSNYFYQIKQPSSITGYIAKYENCDLEGHFGDIFLILQPRIVQSEHYYPIIEKLESKNVFEIEDYSYGIYQNGLLTSQKGAYPYFLQFNQNNLSNKSWRLLQSTKHYIGRQNLSSVIISKQENTYVRVVTMIILLSISSILFILTFKLWLKILKQYSGIAVSWNITQPLLSRRIQTSMLLLLFGGLIASIYISITLVRFNNQSNQTEVIKETLKNIVVQLQNQVDLPKKLNTPEQRQLIVNDLSDVYKVDLNLFDGKGRLLASSKPSVFEDQLFSRFINPKPLHAISKDGAGLMSTTESILDQRFASAYMPLIGPNRSLLGIVNLPYFTNEKELNQEISTLVVNFMSVYAFLIVVGFFITLLISRRITKPLLEISNRIVTLNLAQSNEKIPYESDDEIGQLVTKYNQMVSELESSANQLAESEREGAWREMAKQVAHEIKNPLTPMKLNIQHLQRAWNDQHPKLDEMFGKTSEVLITQINSLSKLASEFSSFADMPRYDMEKVNLTSILTKSIDLYKRDENVSIQFTPEEAHVFADENQLSRVFINLLKNSIQAKSEDKVHIEVNMTLDQDRVIVEVKDNGVGIEDHMKEKVFQPNFSTKNSGMGLGLAISRKIIETSGGSMTCRDNVPKGVVFTVTLPIVKL